MSNERLEESGTRELSPMDADWEDLEGDLSVSRIAENEEVTYVFPEDPEQTVEQIYERVLPVAAQLTGKEVPGDLLDIYFAGLGDKENRELLDREEEVALAQIIEQGKAAQQQLENGEEVDIHTKEELERQAYNGTNAFKLLVQANLLLSVSLASKYGNSQSRAEFADYIQYANEGLMHAAGKFDWRRGVKFSTYATQWIRQRLTFGVAESEHIITISPDMHKRLVKIHKKAAQWEEKHGRKPTMEELSRQAKLPEKKVQTALAAEHTIASLDKPVDNEKEGSPLGNFIADISTSTEEAGVKRIVRAQITDAISNAELTEVERKVITARYGLEGGEEYSLQALADELPNVKTREGVRQIEGRAKKKIRTRLEEMGLNEYE